MPAREDDTRSGGGDAPADELLLRFARAGHDAGYPADDLERRVSALAMAIGVQGVEISATPTMVDMSVGPVQRRRARSLRVRPAAVDLAAIAELDDLLQRVVDGELGVEGALAVLPVDGVPRRDRPWPLLIAAYALAAVALTPLLGGGRNEALAAAAVGLVVGAVALPTRGRANAGPMIAPVAGVAASLGAGALDAAGLPIATDLVTLAALVTLLPGMTLTIGMEELATEHLQSGVANTASALVQLLGLVFGVGVGRSIAEAWFDDVGRQLPAVAFDQWFLLAAVGAGLAFTFTLRARLRDAPLMCAAAALAVATNELATRLVGADAAVFAAALAVGVVGRLVGYRSHRSPLFFIVPGVLLLVPGSTGFRSILQLLDDQTVSGITAGFDTFVAAMSIAYGLLVSTLLLPRRVTEVGRRSSDA
jgi:uncharacterized membrane protein YjjP (DUF1212 family)